MAMAPQASLFTPPSPPQRPPTASPSRGSSELRNSPPLSPIKGVRLRFPPPHPRNGPRMRPAATKEPEAPGQIYPTELDPKHPSADLQRQHWGLLRKAQVEEFYVITWDSSKEQMFEMPTGRLAIMRQGPQLAETDPEEQCLALGTRLRSKYKDQVPVLQGVPETVSPVFAPERRGVPGEGESGSDQSRAEYEVDWEKNVSPIEVKFYWEASV
ncbi:UNVERIFIED_CONTAM: Photosystem I reaction center subunit II, chloroplastic [Sesamum calycinum]|uniref:Photosystem I reaction center subunit II, chloroplastic n=1 Tax=Sesamum calycinum TaxID=2727403 RepID=A0AAW2KNS3_9LAMI